MDYTVPAGTRIGHVHLKVADIEKALQFYRDLLGFQVMQWYGDQAVFISAGGYHHHIGLNTWHSKNAPPAKSDGVGLYHTAILYPTRKDLGEIYRRLRAANYPLTGASDHGVSEALYMDDPDGNGVELYFDRPREVWPPPSAPGDKVGMFTAPLDLESLLAAGEAEPEGGAVVDVGHVHLKVSDVERSVGFWSGELGFDVMARWHDQAAFLAVGGYHHHIGMNTWQSRGAAPGPRELPGLEEVRLRTGAESPVTIEDPDGIRVVLTK